MGILKLKEHTSCYHYAKCVREGFVFHRFSQLELEGSTQDTDCILFVIEGELELACNGEKRMLQEGQMVCFNRRSFCKFHSRQAGSVVIAHFDQALQSCEKVAFAQLHQLKSEKENTLFPLPIQQKLQLYLQLLINYLEDGANCVHFHETKLKELFWSIRFYYTKTEQAAFFHPILGNDFEFKRKVLNHYRQARTVKELAWLCGSSSSSFKRKFLKEFREPASEWLQKQINNIIQYKLANEDVPIGDIAESLHFSSQSQFCRYCKRNFGCTPGEWRKQQKNKYKTISLQAVP